MTFSFSSRKRNVEQFGSSPFRHDAHIRLTLKEVVTNRQLNRFLHRGSKVLSPGCGVTTLDTANVYSNGESEKVIAKFIKTLRQSQSFHRDQAVAESTRDYVNQFGLSRAAIFNSVEASLERLETSYIDLYPIHLYDPNTPAEETMCALKNLVRSGKVRYIGASSMHTWQFSEYNHVAEINGWAHFISMQNHYSLLYREEEREMIPYCNHKGIGLIPRAPLAEGHLARPAAKELRDDQKTSREKTAVFKKALKETDVPIMDRVEELAKRKRHGVEMVQVAMAWISSKVTSPIIGMSSPSRLEDAIPVVITLTAEEMKCLEEPYTVRAIKGHA